MRKPFDGDYPITQTFGNKFILNGVDYYAKYGYLGHNGIDYGLPTGTNLLAPHNGVVKEAAWDAGYGWYLKIENDVEGSVLAHQMTLLVKVGDTVTEGQKVGVSDNTGSSTGPHLHWGYYRFPRDRQNGYGGFIDQTPYIAVIPNPTHNTQPAGDYGTPIRDFLTSKGYTYPETHLDVIKVMYESDLRLKSGQLVTVEDCNRAKAELQQKFNNEKEIAIKEAVAVAVNNAKLEWDKSIEGQLKEYLAVKDTPAYKLCMAVLTILKLKPAKEVTK